MSWAAPYTGAEPLPRAISPSLPRTSVGPPGGGQEPPHRPASPTLHLTSLLPSRGCGALDAPSRSTQGPAACSSLCGIDHEALNKQIMEYKRRKERGCRSESPAESPLTHTHERETWQPHPVQMATSPARTTCRGQQAATRTLTCGRKGGGD